MKYFVLALLLPLIAHADYESLYRKNEACHDAFVQQEQARVSAYEDQSMAAYLAKRLKRAGASVTIQPGVRYNPNHILKEFSVNGGEFVCAHVMTGLYGYGYISCLDGQSGRAALYLNSDEIDRVYKTAKRSFAWGQAHCE